MSRPKPLLAYPNRQFVALVQKVIETDDIFVVPCTRAQAASIRGELYAWRIAAESNPREAEALGVPIRELREISVKITSQGLEIIPARMVQNASLIEAALGNRVPPLETPAAVALRNLINMQAEEPKP